MKKLLFVCKNRQAYGSYQDFGTDYRHGSYGLINSCKLLSKALSEPGEIECKVVSVVDNNSIDREVATYKPTHVFIEALWVVPSKFHQLLKLHPTVQWAVRIHSKTPFLANEGIAFDWINGYVELANTYDNFRISGNDLEFVTDMKAVYGNAFDYLPNLYPTSYAFSANCTPEKDWIDVGCFGSIRPMKNHMQQAIAAVMFASEMNKKLRFHINGRAEQKGDQVLKNLVAFMKGTDNELVLHGWYPHEEFLEIVKTMDIGTQVSFSESFNIVAADFVTQNVPIVVSKDIRWASCMFMAEPTKAEDIAAKMMMAYKWRKWNLQYLNKLSLISYNSKATCGWIEYLYK